MIRIAVVDDENIVCTQLERLINEAADIISITVEIDIYSSSEAFVKILKANEKYDLIFLEMSCQMILLKLFLFQVKMVMIVSFLNSDL